MVCTTTAFFHVDSAARHRDHAVPTCVVKQAVSGSVFCFISVHLLLFRHHLKCVGLKGSLPCALSGCVFLLRNCWCSTRLHDNIVVYSFYWVCTRKCVLCSLVLFMIHISVGVVVEFQLHRFIGP